MQESLHKTNRKTYLIVMSFIMAFALIVLSLWFFSSRYFSHQTVTAYREQAIKPPIPFSELRLYNKSGQLLPHSQWQNKWIVFYVAPLAGKKLYSQNLNKLQQIYQLYLKKSHLDIVVATFSATRNKQLARLLAQQYTHFVHVHLNKQAFLRIFAQVKSKRAAIFMGAFYLVNPQGKLFMDYPANIPAKVLETDLS